MEFDRKVFVELMLWQDFFFLVAGVGFDLLEV